MGGISEFESDPSFSEIQEVTGMTRPVYEVAGAGLVRVARVGVF